MPTPREIELLANSKNLKRAEKEIKEYEAIVKNIKDNLRTFKYQIALEYDIPGNRRPRTAQRIRTLLEDAGWDVLKGEWSPVESGFGRRKVTNFNTFKVDVKPPTGVKNVEAIVEEKFAEMEQANGGKFPKSVSVDSTESSK